MATRRQDGYFCVALDLCRTTDAQGRVKRDRRWFYGRTLEEAQAKRAAYLRNDAVVIEVVSPPTATAAAPPPRPTADMTLYAFLTTWHQTCVAPHRKPSTSESYEQVMRCYIVPHLGTMVIADLTPFDVQAWINTLTNQVSARTVEYARAVLRRALNQALRWRLVSDNVARHVDLPQRVRPVVAPLTASQAQRLLATAHSHRHEALYRVALSLGLRKGEVIGLRWKDIDLDKGTLTVAQTTQRLRRGLTTTTPKSATSARVLPVPDALVQLLNAHQERQQAEQQREGWHDHGLVFPSLAGTPLEPHNLSLSFKRLLKRAGLPTATRFHDLRHSCATLLLAQGVSPKVIQSILGHASIKTTLDIYGHVDQEQQGAALDALDKVLQADEIAKSEE
jgi:integrase